MAPSSERLNGSAPNGAAGKKSTKFALRSAEISDNLHRSRLLLSSATTGSPGDATAAWEQWCSISNVQPLPAELLLMPMIYSKLSGVADQVTGMQFLKDQYIATWMCNELTVKAFETIVELFEDAGIDVVVLKGVALASSERMNDLAVRPFVDVDLLVHPQRYRDAIELLLVQGWESSSVDPSSHSNAHHSINLRRGSYGSIDLHREPLQRSHNVQEDQALWDRSEVSIIGKLPIRIPAISDHIVTVLGHSWVGDFRAAADLWFLFDRASDRDLQDSANAIRRRSLTLHSQRVLTQMKAFFPEMELPLAGLLRTITPSRSERLRDSLEHPSRVPERSAQWSRQLAYWLNRSQGDSLLERSRALYSFALFNTGTTKLGPAVRVVAKSIRLGERAGEK